LQDKRSRARYVRGLFDKIAPRYDLANAVITLGQIKRWRQRLVDEIDLQGEPLVLDLAAGTGDLTLAVARRSPGARIVGVDLSMEMVRYGREKVRRAGVGDRVSFVLADVTALPFRNDVADCVVDAFLLRHIPSLPEVFVEFKRVLRAGGEIASLELTQPTLPVWRQVFGFLFGNLIPLLGWVVSGDYEAFRYLPRSLRPFPGHKALASIMRGAGFEDVRWRLMWLGAVAVHAGRKPAG
jgi:demethylmenaquinone methyltransferase / 2-methoxy-6-polyprenyl-1,4-benzoquinol methylase